MQSLTKTEKETRLRRNEEKWTAALMEAGWTVIPSVFLERQSAFGLDAIDINILMHLARHWWYSDNPPYPRKREIAECMNISMSTVQKRIARMERDGLIQREARKDKRYGQVANAYKFDGLIAKAKPFAQELIQERDRRRAEADARRRRKRPRLQLVPENDGGTP